MTFRSNGSRRPSRVRRSVDWGFGPADIGQTISATGKTLWATGITSAAINLTIVRTHGLVSTYLLTAAAAADGYEGAHGIYMMTEDAFAIGVTAALDPFQDASSDMWLWHSFFDVRAISATASNEDNTGSGTMRIVIDSKAMRKNFDPDRVLVGVTGVTETGTATMRLNANTRMLFKQ